MAARPPNDHYACAEFCFEALYRIDQSSAAGSVLRPDNCRRNRGGAVRRRVGAHLPEIAQSGPISKIKEAAMKGLEGILAFLNFLRGKKIMFGIEQQRDDALMVSFALVGIRIEVEFFVDHIEYSFFEGDESVACDENGLMAMIQKYSE
jgi:hypothetical protein